MTLLSFFILETPTDIPDDAAVQLQPLEAMVESKPPTDDEKVAEKNNEHTAISNSAIPLETIKNTEKDLPDIDHSCDLSMTTVKTRIQRLSMSLPIPIKTADGKGLIKDGFGKEFHVGNSAEIL